MLLRSSFAALQRRAWRELTWGVVSASGKKRTPQMVPRRADEVELDINLFSSSQLIRDGIEPEGQFSGRCFHRHIAAALHGTCACRRDMHIHVPVHCSSCCSTLLTGHPILAIIVRRIGTEHQAHDRRGVQQPCRGSPRQTQSQGAAGTCAAAAPRWQGGGAAPDEGTAKGFGPSGRESTEACSAGCGVPHRLSG